ncbi:hypothetical protein ACM258_00170 [Phaeobacter piscinae]|uniref:hypothetical protein n=1 Tax=Phaeobacter piscinae TaxID=1580596 RepID=UPI0039F6D4E3
MKKQFPGASSYLDRHGKRRWRYRKKGLSIELGTNYASKEFLRRYEDAVSDVERPKSERRVLKHSFYSLSEKYYQSSAYEKLAASTRKKYRRTLESFLAEYGEKSAATIKLRHVRKILNDLHNTPSIANQLLLLLQCLFELAMDYEWRNDNPADKTKPFAEKKENIHTWSEAEIARFEARHPAGTLANTAMNLMLYTGAARVDVVKLGPQNVVEGRLRYRRQKTENSNGVLIDIPLHPHLETLLKSLPKCKKYFLRAFQCKATFARRFGELHAHLVR